MSVMEQLTPLIDDRDDSTEPSIDHRFLQSITDELGRAVRGRPRPT
jgi:hypothetical protein